MSWVTFAQHLEELSIWQCLGLEEIISWEKHNEVAELKENSNFFSKLKILDQHYLPKMKTIYRDALLPFQQRKEIINEKWPMLKKLPLKFNSAKGRKIVIKGEKKWWKDVEWKMNPVQLLFLPLSNLCFHKMLEIKAGKG
ncbi:hypothetical protein Gorai_022123 [Gossypium raimondii]|uniref:Uncharacterized protein n=1 Tax=Gossypium raimondii TaxID=29730 RepID=A0A7J8NSB2_GOSRA|nr:hypothetical protein [Gossypium raimondii]